METTMQKQLIALLIAGLLGAPGASFAEGQAQLTPVTGAMRQGQLLRSGTQLRLDILDPATESISFTGVGTLTVTDAAGASWSARSRA